MEKKEFENSATESSLQPLTEEYESLRDFVDSIIKYSQQRTRIIEEYFKKKKKKGKHIFRFPFILKQEHIISFSNCIQRRLNESYSNNYELLFFAQVEYTNHDILSFQSQEDFFGATHNEKMLRVTMDWEYTINIDINGMVVPHPFDIIVRYEVEQDSDEKEEYKLEEFGAILVEGIENDWINGTLNELKTVVSSTKMPFWFRWPKLAFLYLRDYTDAAIYITIMVFFLSFLSSILNSNKSTQMFLDQLRSVTDVAEKLQRYIEYTLTPRNTFVKNILLNAFIMILVAIFYIVIRKLSRYMFPPSMILIGSAKDRQKNILAAYTFVWGTIATIAIGAIVTMIVKFLMN